MSTAATLLPRALDGGPSKRRPRVAKRKLERDQAENSLPKQVGMDWEDSHAYKGNKNNSILKVISKVWINRGRKRKRYGTPDPDQPCACACTQQSYEDLCEEVRRVMETGKYKLEESIINTSMEVDAACNHNTTAQDVSMTSLSNQSFEEMIGEVYSKNQEAEDERNKKQGNQRARDVNSSQRPGKVKKRSQTEKI